ncbi:hypothetical protein C8J57DRAFT_1259093 [Mycena rebaudengoi]|nr:hypothetical protein C8J57DRAFT_1259093 [Mycena rebaudengoi]
MSESSGSSTGALLTPPSNAPAPAFTEEEITITAVVKRDNTSLKASQANGACQHHKPLIHIQPIIEFRAIRDLLEFDEEAKAKVLPLTINQVHMLESWEILKATIPKFNDDMTDLGGSNKLRKLVCMEASQELLCGWLLKVCQIQEGVHGVHRDDMSTLKHTMIDYLPPLPPTPMPVASEPPVPPPIPILLRGHKGCCGWNHICTAELNCPHKITTYMKIAKGDITVTGPMMPNFMYRDMTLKTLTQVFWRVIHSVRKSIKDQPLHYKRTAKLRARLGMQPSTAMLQSRNIFGMQATSKCPDDNDFDRLAVQCMAKWACKAVESEAAMAAAAAIVTAIVTAPAAAATTTTTATPTAPVPT